MGINTIRADFPIIGPGIGLGPRIEVAMMTRYDGGTTSPTLLRRAADWQDTPAWRELFRRYDPLLRRWSRSYLLDDSQVAEVCQRIWVELADRLGSFRYDPGRSFRGWLRDLCRCRSIDYLRVQRRERLRLENLDAEAGHSQPVWEIERDDPDEPSGGDTHRDFLLREAELAQAAVRAKVESRTWEVYWRIAIEEKTIAETAVAFGMTYTGAFAAYSRVDRRLREEGKRRLAASRKLPF
jgi:RNA polymerase sigma factor (sigma-70 family)